MPAVAQCLLPPRRSTRSDPSNTLRPTKDPRHRPATELRPSRILRLVHRLVPALDLHRFRGDGSRHIGRRHVPALAADHATGRELSQYGRVGLDCVVYRDRGREVDLLGDNKRYPKKGYLVVSQFVRRCRIRESRIFYCHSSLFSHAALIQVDSFIPFWAWDEPAQPAGKSKSSKSSKEKRSSKNKAPAMSALGTTTQALLAEASAAATGASTPLSGEDTDAVPANASKGLGDAPSTGATPSDADRAKSSAMEVGGDANMRKRQMAYVEDAEE